MSGAKCKVYGASNFRTRTRDTNRVKGRIGKRLKSVPPVESRSFALFFVHKKSECGRSPPWSDALRRSGATRRVPAVDTFHPPRACRCERPATWGIGEACGRCRVEDPSWASSPRKAYSRPQFGPLPCLRYHSLSDNSRYRLATFRKAVVGAGGDRIAFAIRCWSLMERLSSTP